MIKVLVTRTKKGSHIRKVLPYPRYLDRQRRHPKALQDTLCDVYASWCK